MTAPDTLDCGHAPTPDTIGTGYAETADGRRVCYPCADDMQRAELAATPAGGRFGAYLSTDGRHVTTWTGGHLATVTRLTGNRRQTFVRARDRDGRMWAGVGPAESGTYVTLRRIRDGAR